MEHAKGLQLHNRTVWDARHLPTTKLLNLVCTLGRLVFYLSATGEVMIVDVIEVNFCFMTAIMDTTDKSYFLSQILWMQQPVVDPGGPRGLVKTSQKKMDTMWGHKFCKSLGPPQTNFWICY